MRRPGRGLIVLGLMLGLGGCLSQPAPQIKPPVRQWNWAASAHPPHLAFGLPNSDDVDVQMQCPPDGPLQIYAKADRGVLLLSSRSLSRTYSAKETDVSPAMQIASSTGDDPVLKAFVSNGSLSVGGRPYNVRSDEERKALRAFARECLR